jgi:processive 1,2-diacylglycerol beta-glucosyltransferase
MAAQRRILIASASAGMGHLRAGEALKQALQARDARWKVEHLDVLTLAPRWVRLAYRGGFELLAAHAPRVWGGIYRWADGPDEDQARWGAVAERLLFRSFRRLLAGGAWDHCACTHFLPAQLAAGRAGFPPFSLVVTDFTLHRFWAQPRVHRYFVATAELAQSLRQRIPGARVDVTGIPVSNVFGYWSAPEGARAALGLVPDQPAALLLGGSLGLRIEETVNAVLQFAPETLQIIVICGKNEAARERLEAAALPERVHIRGYVNEIERFFAAADVIITKPGGLTTSEALSMGKPLLLTRGLPGQEEGNLRALVETGAASDVSTPEQLEQTCKNLFADIDRLARQRAAAAAVGRADAAVRIAAALQQDLLQEVAA